MSFVEASGPWRRELFGPYDWAIGPIDSPAASEDTPTEEPNPSRDATARFRAYGVVLARPAGVKVSGFIQHGRPPCHLTFLTRWLR